MLTLYMSTGVKMIEIKNKRTYNGPGEYVGRPLVLGNPFPIIKDNPEFTRDKVVKRYRKWLITAYQTNQRVRNELHRLANIQDLILICWCAPLACHAEIIREAIISIRKYGSWRI